MGEDQERIGFSDYYQSRVNAILFRWIDILKLRILRQAFSSLPPDGLLVDVGAGAGKIAGLMHQAGHSNVLCLDKDPALLEACRQRGLAAQQLDLDQSLPLADAAAFGVMMIDVIEHVERPREMVAELRRITRPGGVIVVFTPPYDSIRWLLAERFHKLVTRRNADHIAPCTEESFEHLMASFFDDFRLGRTNFNLSMYAVVQV